MKRCFAAFLATLLMVTASAFAFAEGTGPTITYIGHSHLMIITEEGTVIYIDPIEIEGYVYEYDADIILVTHEHSDHNQVDIVPQSDDCVILRVADTINKDNTYNTFGIGEVTIIPVPAENENHAINKTNGLVILFDGFAVYHASDTDKLDSMADLRQYDIDYAFFPIDGTYNMDAAEAMECAELVCARHSTPIHWFSADPAEFTPEGLLYMDYGDTITLSKED